MTPVDRLAREMRSWYHGLDNAACDAAGYSWEEYIPAATELYNDLHETDECICPKCGIRHGGRKGNGEW